MSRVRSAILGAILAVGPLAALAQATSTPEIFKTLIGKTVEFQAPDGSKGTTVYAADGTIKTGWGQFSDTGTWRLTSDSVCTKYKKIRNGTENCQTIEQQGTQYILKFKNTGAVASTITVR